MGGQEQEVEVVDNSDDDNDNDDDEDDKDDDDNDDDDDDDEDEDDDGSGSGGGAGDDDDDDDVDDDDDDDDDDDAHRALYAWSDVQQAEPKWPREKKGGARMEWGGRRGGKEAEEKEGCPFSLDQLQGGTGGHRRYKKKNEKEILKNEIIRAGGTFPRANASI